MRAPAAFDSVVLAAVLCDLRPCVGARVRAVLQPSPAEVALEVRGARAARILISIHARWARIHLSPPVAPGEPGPFAQMARARLTGARLAAIGQPPFERSVTLSFEADSGPCDLVAELMGRHSNLLLVQDGVIAGALKLVTESQSSVREVLPGRAYAPAPRDRQPPAGWTPETLAVVLGRSEERVVQALTGVVLGISPVMARELCVRAGLDPDLPARGTDADRLHAALSDLDRIVHEEAFAPVLYLVDGRPAGFAPFPLQHLSTLTSGPVPTMSDAVAAVTGHLSAAAELEDQRRSLAAAIQAVLRKTDHAAAELTRALEESAGAGRLRSWGELLLAYGSQIPTGSAEAVLPGFDGEMVAVQLDRTLTPVENAQRLFARYARMRDARPQIDARLRAVRDDQRYLASALAMAETASGQDDLAELRRELADDGYLRRRRARPARAAAKPRTLALPGGAHLLVGRSNHDNDRVTFKIAGPEDLWFHARGVPGAHVILRTGGRAPTEDEIQAAAAAAAYFSAARGAGHAAVDYTARKHVRKTHGSKPGMVTYERETTVQAVPGIPR